MFQKSLGGYKLILAPLTIVRDALLNANSFLCQKVLELSLGFKRFPIPFGLFIFYLEKCYNYLIFLLIILINFINIGINNIDDSMISYNEFFKDSDWDFII